MTRKRAWVMTAAALLSGSMAHAQGMMPGNPAYYGNPPAFGGPQAPMPYGMPYQQPMPPLAGFAPAGQPVSRPGYDGVGPKAGAAEPYLVPQEPGSASGSGSSKKPLKLPSAEAPQAPATGTAATMPAQPYGSFEPIGPPPEPYTVYEGRRSLAEERQDNTRVWGQVGVIHWWIRGDETPPLVTTGNPALTAGALGAGDTTILLGNGSIGPTEFTGVQALVGMWLDEDRLFGVEAGGFYLGKNSRQYSFASDAAGNPALSQPIIVNGAERVLQIATPGTPASPVDLAGRIDVSTILSLYGAELNFVRNFTRTGCFTFDYLIGARYIYLNEALNMNQSITALPGANNQIPFLGVPQPAGSNFVLSDSFSSTNRYVGGQIGAKLNWAWGQFDLGTVLKIGAGATFHDFIIDGTSTLNATNGTHATATGGTLAQASNIGTYNRTDFSVVPELNFTLGYQFTPSFRVMAGYTLLYWTHVMRVGNNIDRNLDPSQAPTIGFPTVTPGANPQFPAIRTEFWAQGVNVGMELKY